MTNVVNRYRVSHFDETSLRTTICTVETGDM